MAKETYSKLTDKIVIVNLFVILIAVMGMIITSLYPDAKAYAILISIFSGLFSSSVYAFFYNLITLRANEKTIKDQLRDSFSSSYEEHRLYIPEKIFPSTDGFSKQFDIDIGNEVASSNEFYFKGLSGKKSAIRLHKSVSKFDSIYFMITNPNDTKTFTARARQMLSKTNPTEADVQKKAIKLQDDNKSTIVGLLSRALPNCKKIKFSFNAGLPIIRVEICSTSLYVSNYENRNGKLYNEVLKFGQNSRVFQYIKTSTKNEFDYFCGNDPLIFHNTDDQEHIINVLIEKELIKSKDDWDRCLDLYNIHYQKFTKGIDPNSNNI